MKKNLNEKDFEKIWHFTFGEQRLVGLTTAIALWMESQTPPSFRRACPHTRLKAVALAYFATHEDTALSTSYIQVLESISMLEKNHSTFLAAPFADNIATHLANTQHLLTAYSDILKTLDYPGAESDACSLRDEAKKCFSLQCDS